MRTAPPPSPLLIKAGEPFVPLLVQEGLGVVKYQRFEMELFGVIFT